MVFAKISLEQLERIMGIEPNTIRYWLETSSNYVLFIFTSNVTFYSKVPKTEEAKANLNEAFRIQAISDKFSMKGMKEKLVEVEEDKDMISQFIESIVEDKTKSLQDKEKLKFED